MLRPVWVQVRIAALTSSLLACGATLVVPCAVRAQAESEVVPDGDGPPSTGAHGTERDSHEAFSAAQLRNARLDAEADRRAGGLALLIGGLASTIGGLAVAAIGHDDDFWLPFGLGTAGWGAVNAALSIGMLDLGGGRREAVAADAALRGDALAERREKAIRDQHGSATFYALNLGLDVAYIGTAVLMFLLADHLDAPDDDRLRGYSVAQLGQGVFLFAFDLVEMLTAEANADAIAEVPRP